MNFSCSNLRTRLRCCPSSHRGLHAATFQQPTREGWLHERELLREFLIANKPPAFIRKQNKDLVDSGKRTFRIKSKDGVPVISKTAWTKTILDVHMEDAEFYCKDVTAWARSVLEESEKISEVSNTSEI
jgi:hypothetical protein